MNLMTERGDTDGWSPADYRLALRQNQSDKLACTVLEVPSELPK